MPNQHDAEPPAKQRNSLDDKLRHEREKHPLRLPCDCRKKCSETIPQRRRISIRLDFWKLGYNERKTFVHISVTSKVPATKSTTATSPKTVSLYFKSGLYIFYCTNLR